MLFLKKDKKTKNTFSLVEILISLPLIALLTAFLFKQTFLISRLEKQHIQENRTLKQSIYFQKRIQKMLYSSVSHSLKIKNDGPSFGFQYDNGVNYNPEASNTVNAQLFLDHNKLVLNVSPKKSDVKNQRLIRKEFFFNHVDNVQFSYGICRDQSIIYTDKVPKNETPTLIKMVVFFENNKHTEQYLFRIEL